MTGIDSWSGTAATNATADGGSINWAEGQPPSSVNNTARQMCADIRSAFNDLAYFQYGTGNQGAGNLAVPAVYASATSFTIAGADVTTIYTKGRRLRAVGSSTGTIYGTISNTAYAPSTTTVTVVWDSGSLSNETLVVSLSQIPGTGKPVNNASIKANYYSDFAGISPTGTASATKVHCGIGSSVVLTPRTTGRVRLTISGWVSNATAAASMVFNLNCGTGSAPANGAAPTSTYMLSTDLNVFANSAGGDPRPFTMIGEMTGLTVGTALWGDMTQGTDAGTTIVRINTVLFEELPV